MREKFVMQLPPQGYKYMTAMQKFDHKVRCDVTDLLATQTVGTMNVAEALSMILADVQKLMPDGTLEN